MSEKLDFDVRHDGYEDPQSNKYDFVTFRVDGWLWLRLPYLISSTKME